MIMVSIISKIAVMLNGSASDGNLIENGISIITKTNSLKFILFIDNG
jgi:hypothetical protein